MSKTKTTAGKTSHGKSKSAHGKKPRRGTSAEVRAANLTPWRRDMLARSLQDLRCIFPMTGDIEKVKMIRMEDSKERRHEAVMCAGLDRHDPRKMPSAVLFHRMNWQGVDMRIMTRAAARWMGKSAADFINESIKASIEAALEDVFTETGRYEFPLTRYERAIFKGEQADWCLFARVKSALQEFHSH